MSIRKISQLTGLSIATVSHALNGTRAVSERSRKLIEKAVEEIGYLPNQAARTLRTQRSNTIAMVIPNVEPGKTTNFYFMEVLSGAKDYLEKMGYDLIVSTYSDESTRQIKELQVFQRQWIDGLLLVPNKNSYTEVMNMLRSGKESVPFVMLDRLVDETVSSVYSDHVGAAREATMFLAKTGKKRIGYIGGSTDSYTGYDRYKGYLQAIEQSGIENDEKIVHTAGPYTTRTGYLAAKRLVCHGIDALFVSNNIMTIGAFEYLKENNINIPDQVSIVGFEDYEWMRITTPPITTVRQNPYQMGEAAASILIKKLKNPDYEEKLVIPTEIIVRRSHG